MLGDKYFEDFDVGEVYHSDGFTITESQIIDFANQWDPHFFHMDVERAPENELLGGFCASGLQTLCIMMRMAVVSGVLWPGVRGGRAAQDVRWLRPVRPDDTLRTDTEVVDLIPLENRPGYGMVKLKHTCLNQKNEAVMTMTLEHIFLRRQTQIA